MSAKLYAKVNGVLLLIIGIIGFFTSEFLGIRFDPLHNIVHLVIALIALYIGFGNFPEASALSFAKTFGLIYIVLGIMGFFLPDFFGLISLELQENLLHLILGIWGIWIGFSS